MLLRLGISSTTATQRFEFVCRVVT